MIEIFYFIITTYYNIIRYCPRFIRQYYYDLDVKREYKIYCTIQNSDIEMVKKNLKEFYRL